MIKCNNCAGYGSTPRHGTCSKCQGRGEVPEPPSNDLIFDASRAHLDDTTGIPIRGKLGEKWCAMDINCLTRESLIRWMNSKSPEYVQNIVLALLGHEQIPSRSEQ